MTRQEDLLKALANSSWEQNFAGPWLLYECCFYGEQLTKSLKKHYGVGFNNSVYIFSNSRGVNYLIKDELRAFGQFIAKKFVKDPDLADRWALNIKTQADRVYKLMDEVRFKKINLIDTEKLWDILNNFLVANFPIKTVVDFLPPPLLEKLIPTFRKARVYAEPVYDQAAKFIEQFAGQIALETKLETGLILSLSRAEMAIYLKDKKIPPKKELESRYKKSALIFHNGKRHLITGKPVDSLEKILLSSLIKNKFIRGTVAFGGKVTGKVRIVLDPSKIKNYEKGSILVAVMTRPEYFLLISKSAAIVTDAGGILSHAAITARELKIPAVIGTKIATKVLKDGDMIEVDANKGVVKIIKTGVR